MFMQLQRHCVIKILQSVLRSARVIAIASFLVLCCRNQEFVVSEPINVTRNGADPNLFDASVIISLNHSRLGDSEETKFTCDIILGEEHVDEENRSMLTDQKQLVYRGEFDHTRLTSSNNVIGHDRNSIREDPHDNVISLSSCSISGR